MYIFDKLRIRSKVLNTERMSDGWATKCGKDKNERILFN